MRTKPSHKNLNGFTLVELIVVILIVGILSISVAPRFFAVASYQDRKAVDELLTALRYTQQMAMNRGGNIQLILAADHFRVEHTTNTPPELRNPDGSIHADCVTPPNYCYRINFEGITASPVTNIIYDRLGNPNAGLTINIGTRQIRIEAVTGYAHEI